MKKEIGKAINNSSRNLALYWITRKLFFTCSRKLMPKRKDSVEEESEWIFIGSCYRFEIPPEILENSDGKPPPPASPRRAKMALEQILKETNLN